MPSFQVVSGESMLNQKRVIMILNLFNCEFFSIKLN